MLAQFEERGVKKNKLNDGVMIEYAETKYWVKWDGEESAKFTARLNITRMFQDLLKSKGCPLEIKLELARELNNGAAKSFLASLPVQPKSPAVDVSAAPRKPPLAPLSLSRHSPRM